MPSAVELTPEAERDLDDILRYVASDSPTAAVRLIERLWSDVQSLSTSAMHYPVIVVRHGRRVRRRVSGSYNLLFEAEGEHVVVLRIVHGARDVSRFFPDS